MLKAIQKKIGVTDDNKDAKVVKDLYKRPTKDKGKQMPKFANSGASPGYIYQADTLYMPQDGDYKYALIVVDTVSGITDGEPLKTHSATETKKAFEAIFSRKFLKPPKFLMEMDQGKEFDNATIKKYFSDMKVGIKYGDVDRHRQQAIVENRNKLLSVALFQKQNVKELIEKKENTEWTQNFRDAITALNKHIKKVNKNKKPEEKAGKPEKLDDQDIKDFVSSIKKTMISDAKINNPKSDKTTPYIPNGTTIYAIGTKVRKQLDAPVSIATGKKLNGTFRATDIRFSPKVYTITNSIYPPNQPVMYALDNNTKTYYTFNQLQLVGEK